jgi:hypothetical protein
VSQAAGSANGLYVELTLTADDPDELVAAGFDWLTLGLVAALSDERWMGPDSGDSLAADGRAVMARWNGLAIPEGSTFDVDHFSERLQERRADGTALTWLLTELRRRPVQTTLRVGTAALGVAFWRDMDGFVKLIWEVDERLFSSPAGPSAADGILRTLWYLASRYRPVFGHVSYGNNGPRTELERNLPRMVGNPFLTTPRWQEFLRGYSWWTIVPGELLERVGGIAGLRESGAFLEVLEIPGGGAWLRATERFADYDEGAVRAVWLALRDAVIPGTPKPETVYPDSPPNRLTVFEAADSSA